MDRPDLRKRIFKRYRSTLASIAMKTLALDDGQDELVIAVIHADDPIWLPLLNKLAPDWEERLFTDGQPGSRFVMGAVSVEFLDFLCNLSPADESGIRAPAPPGCAKVFVLGFGSLDLFYLRYAAGQDEGIN